MQSHAFGSSDGGPTSVVPTFAPSWVDNPVLRLEGRVEGTAVVELGTMLDAAVSHSVGRVTLDVSAVDSWSLLAQAMVLNTARVLASRQRLLVLVAPSPALRDQSDRLQVFERVATDAAW